MPSLPSIENQKKEDGKEPDFSEVQGQTAARRAALIAAAGFHNLLMLGPPGSGKSMIARRIPTIMPPMSEEEQMEVTRIYSIAGMLAKGEGVRRERPFRAPHHTMTPQALAGGGKQPSPGEITLAHRGVLFLDELPEMTRTTIEILRQPLEEHRIVISRVSRKLCVPGVISDGGGNEPLPLRLLPRLIALYLRTRRHQPGISRESASRSSTAWISACRWKHFPTRICTARSGANPRPECGKKRRQRCKFRRRATGRSRFISIAN